MLSVVINVGSESLDPEWVVGALDEELDLQSIGSSPDLQR